jgi:hypothetical protein
MIFASTILILAQEHVHMLQDPEGDALLALT